MSVLKCTNETKRFHTFESNRLTVICNGSSTWQWRYVSSEKNPADDASKGLKLDEMTKNSRWLKFLWEDESTWLKRIVAPTAMDSDPAMRKENLVCHDC